MTTVASTDIRERLEREYVRRTPRSGTLFERAARYLPGGNTRLVVYFPPYPIVADRGLGASFTDVDGNRYLDLLNNYTSLIHGHAHARITEVVAEQLTKGTAFATGLESQVDLASLLCERVASVDSVRFTNSGTEATLFAIRLAKAFTGRNKVVKIEGGYHGTHDVADISMYPKVEEIRPGQPPLVRPTSAGIFRGVVDDVVVVPYNNVEASEQLIRRDADDIAAIILEPALGGTIGGRPEYLKFMREISSAIGALLILDEVVTYRVAPGGAQQLASLKPDLTCFGKTIGGGFPVGAVGGRREVMDLMGSTTPAVPHSGTFNGNPITMVAGRATLELLTSDAYEHLARLGERLRAGLRHVFEDAGVAAQVMGTASLAAFYFAEEPVQDIRGANRNDPRYGLIHLALLNRGVFIAARGMMAVSTVTTEADIDFAIEAFRGAVAEIVQ